MIEVCYHQESIFHQNVHASYLLFILFVQFLYLHHMSFVVFQLLSFGCIDYLYLLYFRVSVFLFHGYILDQLLAVSVMMVTVLAFAAIFATTKSCTSYQVYVVAKIAANANT